MIINTNLMVINSQINLGIIQNNQGGVMKKLSSGIRINRAGNDAAGLTTSKKMRNQIYDLYQLSRNSQAGMSLIQTADGALGKSYDMLKRMRKMTIQAMNEYTEEDRKKLDSELQQLITEIDSTVHKTEFNEKELLKGELTGKGLASIGDARKLLANNQIKYYSLIKSEDSMSGIATSIENGASMNKLTQSVIDVAQKRLALEIKAVELTIPTSQTILESVAIDKTSLAGIKASISKIELQLLAIK